MGRGPFRILRYLTVRLSQSRPLRGTFECGLIDAASAARPWIPAASGVRPDVLPALCGQAGQPVVLVGHANQLLAGSIAAHLQGEVAQLLRAPVAVFVIVDLCARHRNTPFNPARASKTPAVLMISNNPCSCGESLHHGLSTPAGASPPSFEKMRVAMPPAGDRR